MSLPSYSRTEVAKHDTADSLWVIIDGGVYDLTAFAALHPGGVVPLKEVAGQDATADFYGLHRAAVLANPRFAKLKIGLVKSTTKQVEGKRTNKQSVAVPYASPTFWRTHSPYYKPSHKALRQVLRGFIEKEIVPNAARNDEMGKYPTAKLHKKMGEEGVVAALFGSAGAVLKRLGYKSILGVVDIDEWDEFHELIMAEEFKRFGCYGLSDGLVGGLAIGLPVILKFGSEDLIQRVAVPVIQGDKRICLCVTEPYAGSDVSKLRATATLTDDGKFWRVRGNKKWITGGMFSDYFTVLCQTVVKGKKGMTMLVVERDDTVSTKAIKTAYSAAAGTAYVEFDDTLVPVENQIGKANWGFMYAMANFNKERWGMIAGGNAMSRLMVEECFKWAMQRKIFGKRLIDQAVIRFKLAEMIAEVEAVHSMLEDLTYQMIHMDNTTVDKKLAGPIALLKFKQTRVATLVSDHACQIFGGRALTRSGMGMFIEKFQRSFKMQAILGGSEEVMADFAVRQAMKLPKDSQLSRL